jgi:hypothetical protein
MNMQEYFKNTKGIGILSTADGDGKVNTAIYGRPHSMADGTIAFIMLERLTHHNLQSNPHASYLFIEKGDNLKGLRLHISKIREEQNSKLLYKLRRVKYSGDENHVRYLVFFGIDTILPLLGADESDLPFEL